MHSHRILKSLTFLEYFFLDNLMSLVIVLYRYRFFNFILLNI